MVKAHPDKPAALAVLANAQLASGETANAVASLRRLAELRPNDPMNHVKLGYALLRQGDVPSARRALDRAVELSPNHMPALANRVAVELAAAQPDKARAFAKKLQAAYPNAAVGYKLEGDVLSISNAHAEAAAAYAAAYQRGPTAQIALLAHHAYRRAGQLASASVELSDWLNRHPDDVPVRLALAKTLDEQQRTAEAIAEYEALNEQTTDDAEILSSLARLYELFGDARALPYARRASSLAPSDLGVLENYGWIELRLGDSKEGLKALQQAALRAPHIPRLRYRYAVALQINGDTEAATVELNRLLRVGGAFPERPEAATLLARLRSTSP